MIVACPNCQSKYNLPEEKIAPNGSKVRCARCKHVFTVMPPGKDKDFDSELAELTAAAAKPAAPAPEKPKAEPAPAPAPAAAPAAEPKMPWDEDAPAAGPAEDASTKKMPWEEDEADTSSGAGRKDDEEDDEAKDEAEEPAPAPAGKSPFDDDEPAPASGGHGGETPPAGPSVSGGDDFLNALDGGAPKNKAGKGSKKKKFIILGVVLVLIAAVAGGLVYFKPWTKMNIPFLAPAKKETAENVDKVKDIALRNVRQYYIPNEKAGNIFVVEGKAVNNFTTPKERIKVEISLFDDKGHVLTTKQLLCGNTLSQFQLQVQSEEEINASLNSEVGILTSNTYLKTGMDTPFMAVFFKPPDQVKEFGVKVIDALDPK